MSDSSATEARSWESYKGDPEPHFGETSKRLHVHWFGYLRDPKPTEAVRATGMSVIVYGANSGLPFQHTLPPTSYSLPEPWESRWFAWSRGPGHLYRGGEPGSRFLSDGHGAWVVADDVYDAATSFKVLGAGASKVLIPAERGQAVSAVNLRDRCGYVQLGPAWVSAQLYASLFELEVETVIVNGELGPIVAPGVAAVMPVRDALLDIECIEALRQGETAC